MLKTIENAFKTSYDELNFLSIKMLKINWTEGTAFRKRQIPF